MSKALKIAAIVVGVAAVVLTGGVALLGAPAVAGFLGVSVATLATITTVLGVAATALNFAAAMTAPKPGFGSMKGAGSQLDFVADPTAGMPYVMGNARIGESVVHEASWGAKNKFLGIVGVLSCAGPILAYDGLFADNTAVTFSGGNATGYYHNFLYEQVQLGARPESAALTMTAPDASTMPDWGSDHKTSSLATAGLILVADVDKGQVYSGGVPQLTHQVRGVLAYDPRLDSTNGGSGAQRPGGLTQAETSYAYSENPWAHHGTYALGRWVNGVRVCGPGLPATSIDWASHIEAANIADANGWTISGAILSSDNKWNVLQSIAQAGGGYPVPAQAKLSCLVNTPRVSLETIEESHVKGAVSVPQMAMRRDRLNGAIPKYREPTQGWQPIDGNIVRNADYLAADGGVTKTKEIELPLVSDKDQAAQLVAYEVANSRERSPIQVPLDLYWSQYKMGDCLTLNLPSVLLDNQKCVVIGREIDAAAGIVTLTFRTEDDAKHTWALGVTGGTPSSATVATPHGGGDAGNMTTADIQTALRDTYPVFGGATINSSESGGVASVIVPNFSIEYSGGVAVAVTGTTIGGLAPSTTYYPYIEVTGIGDNAPTFGVETSYADALNSSAHPFRVYLNQQVTTPASGSGGTVSGGGYGGGYSGGGAIP